MTLESRRLSLALLLGERHEVTNESWRAEYHDLEEGPEWTGFSVFFKIIAPMTGGQPGSSMDHALSEHAPWRGASPPAPIVLRTRIRSLDVTMTFGVVGARVGDFIP